MIRDERTMRAVIDARAGSDPGAAVVIAPESGAKLDGAALREAGFALAARFDSLGVPPGAVVSFMLDNGLAAANVLLGTMYAGRIASPINLIAQDAHVAHVIAHSGTRAVFASDAHLARLRPLIARQSDPPLLLPIAPDEILRPPEGAGRASLPPLAEADIALLMYTSGTTGVPKGALLSHANLIAAARAVAAAHALGPADRVLSSLPLYHINGQCIALYASLVAGGSAVLPHRFSASQWWPQVARYAPTWLNFVPTIVSYLLHGRDLTPEEAAAARNVRFARCASAPLPVAQQREFESRFGIAILEAMGLTESASIAFANPLEPAKRKAGTPGVPLGVEARVVAPDGKVLADDAPGEIEIRGESVMRGYFRSPEETAATLKAGGWLATGDLGHRDRDGFYFITGRRKELIIKGGENIAPREIDDALLRHPAVLEAAAVGVPDPGYGQEILACVVVKPGMRCTEDELREFCRRELGRFKSPRYFRFVAELPKGPSGKIQRLSLARLHAASDGASSGS